MHFVIPNSKLIFGYSLLFAIGIMLFYYFIGDLELWQSLIVITLLVPVVFKIHDQVVGIATIFAVLFIITWKVHSKVLRFFGKISYSLYLVHVPIGGRIINVFDQFVKNENLRSIGVFIALAVAIFAAWIFYLIIEKPSMIWSKKISYTRDKQPNTPVQTTLATTTDSSQGH
jgi:peptidoglycan/LPS O-acetylase OafA/YrhL